MIKEFYERGVILPVILIDQKEINNFSTSVTQEIETSNDFIANRQNKNHIYHSAEVRLKETQLSNIHQTIDKAISQFLHLAPNCSLRENPHNHSTSGKIEEKQNFLLLQQRRLAEKLKERLGYLGVYYKRNPHYFYRHLSEPEKKQLMKQLSEEYRKIILDYFGQESKINQQIDQFVNQAFFADVSVSQILEIHMELMDELSQQLKLEGRNEDILLDYRLALIDLIAHLSEMYRRSIPQEDIPFDMLFPVD